MSNRVNFLLYHLFFSGLLLVISLIFIYCIWYASPLYIAQGVNHIYFMVIGIDIIIGPLLTLILYKKDRKKFIFDIVIVLIIQISFYIYGLMVIEKGRVFWIVFVVDDIELVTSADVGHQEIPNNYKVGVFDKSMWVAAVYSDDPKIKQNQREDEMFNGVSLATRSETYQSLYKQKVKILKKLKSLNELQKYNNQYKTEQMLKPYKNVKGWLPVKAKARDMVAIFNSEAQPIAIVDLKPWN